MGKKIGIGVGIFFGVLIVVLVAVVTMMFQKPAPPSPPPTAPSGATPTAPPIQQQIEQVQQAIQKAQQTGEPQDITLVITEQTANEEIAKALKNQPPGGDLVIREATIFFRKGIMEMHLNASLMGITIYPKVSAGVTVQDGRPVAQNLRVEVGMVGLPGGVSDMVRKTVEDQFDALLKSFGANVTFKSVQIDDFKMVVQGTVK